MAEGAVVKHERRAYDKEIAELTGSFKTYQESTRKHFESLHKETNQNCLAIEHVQTRLCAIETAVTPIKDLAAFFRILKWLAGFITIASVILGALIAFFKLIGVQIFI